LRLVLGFPPVAHTSLFEELGGEARLRPIIDDFVDRVCDDTMIGFFFRNVDRARLKQREYEFAAKHLGANIKYQGRPIDAAHAPHPIMGGQFMRRLKILEETLVAHDVPERVRQHWIAHTESLRRLVTRDAGGQCDDRAARERVEQHVEARRPKVKEGA
jgi:hemoglobin